jgi:hypothetical protein
MLGILEFIIWAIGAALVFTLIMFVFSLVVGGLIALSSKVSDKLAQRK